MNPIWVNFVEDDHEIGDYAWGQAALVEIVDTLVSFRENGCLGGCMSALMAFAFQHIKPLQELFRCENDPNTFPLVVGWGERLCHTLKDTHNPKLDEDIFSCFHELGLEDICANPYNQCFRLMPQHYQKEKRMELAILPIFRVDRGIFNEPYKYSNPQVEITTDRKEEMKNWMKNHYSIAEKNYRQYKNFQCKGLRGKWIKDYWQQWKVKLGMDVSFAQLTDEQPWLPKVMDMDVDETPVDGAAAEMDEDGPAMDDGLIEDQVVQSSVLVRVGIAFLFCMSMEF